MVQKKGRNKIVFTTFIILTIIIIVLFTLAVKRNLKRTKEIYKVPSSSLLLDENYNIIKLKEESNVKRKWDNKYYLETEDEKYTLGSFTLAYNPNDYRINTFGEYYQVYKNGDTKKYIGTNEIIRTSEETFYKINDRKYFIVSSKITDKTRTISTKDYLIVELDKIGNATLINDELNLKTINEIVLDCGAFKFDVANEKLIYGENEIDLKKIGGSTNEYVPKEIDEKSKDKKVKQLSEKDLAKLESQIASKIKENNELINNNFSNSTTSVTNAITDITATVNTVTDKVISQKNYYKAARLISISSGVNYLDVNYYISDPTNEYSQVYLKIQNNAGITNIYNVNKSESVYRILDLVPDQEYTVSLCYKYTILSDLGTIEKEETADVIKYKTHLPNYELTVAKVTKNKIYFNFKSDQTYTIQSGKVTLYIDNVEKGSNEINIAESLNPNGYTGYINYENPGMTVVLKLENAVYNDTPIELDVQAKYMN